MGGKRYRWWSAPVLFLALLAPGTAQAGPYFGEWAWCWKPGPDCPCSEYSCWHYWAPTAYWVKYCAHPAYLDEYPPGVPVATTWETNAYPCRAIHPMPTTPYADPEGYYGRQIVPPEDEANEKKDDATGKKKEDAADKKKENATDKKKDATDKK